MRLIIPRRLASEGEELPPWFYGLAYTIACLPGQSVFAAAEAIESLKNN